MSVIGSVQRGHPNLACAERQCRINRRRVESSDRIVQDQPAKDTNPSGVLFGDDCPVGRQRVMRLEQHGAHACFRCLPRQLNVVH